MDLAKIRKKLKEKEEKRDLDKPAQEAGNETAREFIEVPAVVQEPEVEEGDLGKESISPHADSVERSTDLDEEEEREEHLVEFLVFTISDEYYAFRLPDLQEVLKEQIITFVPKMPKFIWGVTSLRGKIIPVMNLKERLSIEDDSDGSGRKQMIILKGPRGPIGVIIDKVVGVRRIEEELVTEPPSHLDEKQIAYIESVVRDKKLFISILNTKEVFDFQPYTLGRRAS